MERETIEIDGRKYEAYVDGEHQIIKGPMEGLVDDLDLPEEFATRLHNALHRRGILTYKDAVKKSAQLMAALQEAYKLDAQLLMQAFYDSQNEGGYDE